MSHYTAYLRGMNFRPESARLVAKQLVGGETLSLQREPSNIFDINAVQVIDPVSGEFIGYVATEIAADLAAEMDAGVQFTCIVDFAMNGSIILAIAEIVEVVDETNSP